MSGDHNSFVGATGYIHEFFWFIDANVQRLFMKSKHFDKYFSIFFYIIHFSLFKIKKSSSLNPLSDIGR